MATINPSSMPLQDLLVGIDSGTIAIPEFQRKYEWKVEDIKKLFDSILHDYPIGSLLFLQFKKQFCVKEVERSPMISDYESVEYAILDGQQRLTSAYQAIYCHHKDVNFFINLRELYRKYREAENDADDVIFSDCIEVKKSSGRNVRDVRSIKEDDLLPFYLLIEDKKSTSYNVQYNAYRDIIKGTPGESQDYIDFISNELNTLIDPIFTCTIPVLQLSSKLKMGAICRIFETLNTAGKKLDSFDICVAKFFKDFKIRTKLTEAVEKINPQTKTLMHPYLNQFMKQNANRVYILQIIALVSKDVKTHSKNKLAEVLSPELLETHWDNSIMGLEYALQFMDGYGACTGKTLALIPYMPAVLVIAAALVKCGYVSGNMPAVNRDNVFRKIRKYFFYTALELRYGEGAMTKTKDDTEALYSWLISDDNYPEFMKKDASWYPNTLLTLDVSSKGARINMIRCLMNIQEPRDFKTEKDIVSYFDKTDLHHIFPESRYFGVSNKNYSVDTVFNKTYISSTTNKSIGRERTKDYVKSIIDTNYDGNEEMFKHVLNKHFIDDIAYHCLINEDFDGFIDSRVNSMFEYLRDNIGINITIVTSQSEEEELRIADDSIE